MGYLYNLYRKLEFRNYPYLAILLLVYIFTFPFNNYIPRMPILSFMSVTTFIEFSILMVLLIELILNKRKFIEYNQYLYLFLFILIILFSTFWAKDIMFSFHYIWQLFHLLILYFLITQLINTKWLFKWLIIILILSGLVVSLFGLGQYLLNPNTGVSSLISDSNDFASFLIFLIPLTFCLFKFYKNFKKIILFLIFILMSLVLILTLSRGGFIAFLVILFLIFLNEKRKISFLILFLLLFLICLPLIPMNFWLRVGTLFGLEAEQVAFGTIEQRARILGSGLKMFLNNFLTGVGIGNFRIRFPEYIISPPFGYGNTINRPAHNMFLGIAAELGIFGLLVFLFLIWDSFKILMLSKIKFLQDKEMFYLVKGLSISFVGVLVTGLFLSIEWRSHLWLLFSMIATLKYLKI